MGKIVICGEALTDFVPRNSGQETAFVAKPGGSPYNASKAAALAGGQAYFHGAISRDFLGDMLYKDLIESTVDPELVVRSDKPTTLAFVDISSGSPRYAFFNADSASLGFVPSLDSFDAGPDLILGLGSIALIDPPAADAIAKFAIQTSARALIALDPNVRSNMILDRPAWEARINSILEVASILKLSTEDLAFLRPGQSASDFARTMLGKGIGIVFVTDGKHGATAYNREGSARLVPHEVEIVDTVGAGDSFMGAALVRISEMGIRSKSDLERLNRGDLFDILRFAVTGATLNCTRSGCSPPSRAKIDAAMQGI